MTVGSTKQRTVSRAINLQGEDQSQLLIYQYHLALGHLYRSKGSRDKAVEHLDAALKIVPPRDWHLEAFFAHFELARLFFEEEGSFDDAHAHLEQAKQYVVKNPFYLTLAMEYQAGIWYCQGRFGEAEPELSRAVDAYEKLGATDHVEMCRKDLSIVRAHANQLAVPDLSDLGLMVRVEFLKVLLLPHLLTFNPRSIKAQPTTRTRDGAAESSHPLNVILVLTRLARQVS